MGKMLQHLVSRLMTIGVIDRFKAIKVHQNHKATVGVDGVRTFLGFAQRIHVTWKESQDGYEVVWSDVRFCYNRKLPFGVDVRLDRDLNVVHHQLGWRKKAWAPPFV
ncbi:hypothetical protein [uncultured Brevibacillus sp.]|uniref:hypothetical protein n=1 Tax=uncultured Brevibacillus sp. TaxID=169970 RepID=UPI002594C126|nr:hypothetical protein [uncultured Brevibacillus sp.]